ncbi:phage BR0599 family protein [Marilutibacter alkalisoli]|uniref:Bacteriophage phiJL001 Gp84 C-terminal domain-containing protein n=1 Tax=Marilutibacter alkalisoli TaxID=2591633 RepID=A0A514BUY5_9GAMM|nr:phage BR0599 family protein [Lysobacter alkalisoli]QDH70839.1 hypothetical protein FKV23_12670 [Lysobacter alkalisoli]
MSLFARHVELIEFFRNSRFWRYTSGNRIYTAVGQDYLPYAIDTGRTMQSAEENRNNREIKAPVTLPFLDIWRPYPPMERIHVTIKRVKASDGSIERSWTGIVADVKETAFEATIRCQTLIAAAHGMGLRRNWQVPCPFATYGAQCGVPLEDFRVPASLTLVDGVTVQAAAFAAFPDGWFNGGFIRWQASAFETERRFVVTHSGDTLTLLTPMPGGVTAVDAFPGDDHSLQTCDEKFNNAVRYGGQHTIPEKNPFGSDPVF